MQKIIIDNKEYDISCNAFTRFQYKSIFGKGIFADIKILKDFSDKQLEIKKELTRNGLEEKEIEEQINSAMMENLDDFIDVITKIAYILIYTANPKVGSFEDWLKGLTKIDLAEKWVTEVTEFAVSSFC